MRITVWSPVNTDVFIDDELVMRIVRENGFNYAFFEIVPDEMMMITFKAKGFEIQKNLSRLIDINGIDGEIHIRQNGGTVLITEDQERLSYGDTTDVPQLLKQLISDKRYSARAWAAECLGQINDQSSIPILIQALSDRDPYVQAKVATALGELQAESALTALKECYKTYSKKSAYGWMFERVFKMLDKDYLQAEEYMLSKDFLSTITFEDIQNGWELYDHPEGELREFISKVPAARTAYDAAAKAMENGDEKARSTWEGFLRALYIIEKKILKP